VGGSILELIKYKKSTLSKTEKVVRLNGFDPTDHG
jgi:hypothetical protein